MSINPSAVSEDSIAGEQLDDPQQLLLGTTANGTLKIRTNRKRISSKRKNEEPHAPHRSDSLPLGEIFIPNSPGSAQEANLDIALKKWLPQMGLPDGNEPHAITRHTDLWMFTSEWTGNIDRDQKRQLLKDLAGLVKVKIRVAIRQAQQNSIAPENLNKTLSTGTANPKANPKSQAKAKKPKLIKVPEIRTPSDYDPYVSVPSWEQVLSLSPASILIAGVGLQGHAEVFAELVGCAPTSVVLELCPLLKPPIIKLKHLPIFMQCAARNVTDDKSSRPSGVVELVLQVASAVASAVQHSSSSDKEQIQELVRNTVHYGYRNDAEDIEDRDHKDTGCRVGLLIAGIQLYIEHVTDAIQHKRVFVETLIEVSANLLTGVPTAGFVFGAVGVLVKNAWNKRQEDKIKKKRDLIVDVRQFFRVAIASQIFLDDELTIKTVVEEVDSNGIKKMVEKTKSVEIKDAMFSKWYQKIMEWTGTELY
jgi:hypothetical protein